MNLLEVYETEEGLQFRFVPPSVQKQIDLPMLPISLLDEKIEKWQFVTSFLKNLRRETEGKLHSVFGIDGVSTPQRKTSLQFEHLNN